MKTKRIVFIGLGVLVGIASILAGCQLWSNRLGVYQGEVAHKIPHQIPFSLKKAGSSVEILVRMEGFKPRFKGEKNIYDVSLLALRDNKWDYGDENWMRFRALIPDGSYYTGPGGEHIPDPKIKPFKLRVQVDSVDPDIGVHTDQSFAVNTRNSHHTYDALYEAEVLDVLRMDFSQYPKSTIYRIHVTNLEARPDVDWIPMRIEVRKTYLGK